MDMKNDVPARPGLLGQSPWTIGPLDTSKRRFSLFIVHLLQWHQRRIKFHQHLLNQLNQVAASRKRRSGAKESKRRRSMGRLQGRR
ncbi:uncharacterized protein LOC9320234 isoform X2 [Arabidopsis lyrata subsp. lyrata]|uniref:uncharacterized protein LOC9320234 isoform X2 n=1 Tax=Arabidopsis lyrata subsp. lyrata TaxID=81972 RepID=UPI000A29D38F|nr:uncharacterized protein LOC9320234 isoform X2 [Arabidopsis lyrata subsp. lyrata]|eukprot:XP_020887683.1 uncharacterized protein LOC9320234 isoform X2 [Arabidopsis lyrata subsp. lyrata]